MKNLILGLLALLAMSVLAGSTTHWSVGVLVVALPTAFTYVRLKLSPEFGKKCDARLETQFKKP